jgi:hypothetical protein
MKSVYAVLVAALVSAGFAEPSHAALGRYCSVSYTGGGWAFESATNLTGDPCADIKTKHGNSGKIERAGLYSTNKTNNVVARCNIKQSYVLLFVGTGNGPLTAAYDRAVHDKQKNCIFTVAPRELALFNSPFSLGVNYTHITGVDFARSPYKTLDLAHDFGRPGASTHASVVDWKARDESGVGFIDDHDGHDILIKTGTVLRSVAAGRVLAARFRDVEIACGRPDKQGEVWIEHRVSGKTGKVSSSVVRETDYDEYFVTFYAHESKIVVKPNQIVAQGTEIGLSGSTGCSSAPHIHFGTFRITNTAAFYVYPSVINTLFGKGKDQNSSNLYKVMIDAYGFYPPKGFDPWAWKAYPQGALSINLWNSGQAPNTGNW